MGLIFFHVQVVLMGFVKMEHANAGLDLVAQIVIYKLVLNMFIQIWV